MNLSYAIPFLYQFARSYVEARMFEVSIVPHPQDTDYFYEGLGKLVFSLFAWPYLLKLLTKLSRAASNCQKHSPNLSSNILSSRNQTIELINSTTSSKNTVQWSQSMILWFTWKRWFIHCAPYKCSSTFNWNLSGSAFKELLTSGVH